MSKKAWQEPIAQIDRFELEDNVATSNPSGQWQGYDGPDNPDNGGTGVEIDDDFWG